MVPGAHRVWGRRCRSGGQPSARSARLDGRGSGRTGHCFSGLHGVRLQSADAAGAAPCRRPLTEPSASGPGAGRASAVPLRGLRWHVGGVLAGNRCACRGTSRRGVVEVGAAVDAGSLELSDHRHHPGGILGVLRTGLGRLVVLGSGGERQFHALAGRHGPAAFGHCHGKARSTGRLDTVSIPSGLHLFHAGSLSGPVRRPDIRARFRRGSHTRRAAVDDPGRDLGNWFCALRLARAQAGAGRSVRADQP